MRRPRDVHLILTDPDGLDQDRVEPGGIQDEQDILGGARQAPEVPARRHAANERAWIEAARLQADSITQDRSACIGAGTDRPRRSQVFVHPRDNRDARRSASVLLPEPAAPVIPTMKERPVW